MTINTSDGYGNSTGSNGYASVGVGLNATNGTVIEEASSQHSDPDVRMFGNWDYYTGYRINYYY